MRTTTQGRVSAAWRTVLASGLAAVVGVGGAAVAHADPAADEVAVRVNQERAANGQGALARDATLDSAAVEWARHMAATGTFEHSTNQWRQQRARPGWAACCGENIAAGYGTAEAVMTGWMNSPGHRANILNGQYSHIGVGHVNVPGSPYGHYWVQIFATYRQDLSGDRAFVRELYRDFLGREARGAEVDHWVGRLAGGNSRYDVALALAHSDEWLRRVISEFYRDTLGREPDARGLARWVEQARAGKPIVDIAVSFYASDEYYRKTGRSNPTTWVTELYRALLGRGPDGPGLRNWVGKLNSGTPRTTVARGFYQSQEKARQRVQDLYQTLLHRPADANGLRTWPPRVIREGDLSLAAWLASSDEYYRKAR